MFARLLIIILIWLSFAFSAQAQEALGQSSSFVGNAVTQPSDDKAIGIKLVDGHLVASFDITSRRGTQSVSLIVNLSSNGTLSLDEKFLDELGLNIDRGFLTLKSLDGFSSLIRAKTISKVKLSKNFVSISDLYSEELGQRPIVGSVGLGALKRHHISINLEMGMITLTSPKLKNQSKTIDGQAKIIALTNKSHEGILLSLSEDNDVLLELSTSQYDTLVNKEWAAKIGFPAGNIPNVSIKLEGNDNGFNLSNHIVFRPTNFNNSNANVKFVSGLNLFINNIVDIDLVNQTVSFKRFSEGEYPTEDLLFFEAMVSNNEAKLLAFLKQYPSARLASDAASVLLDRRLENLGNDAEIIEAARYIRDTALDYNRGGTCLALIETLQRKLPDRHALIIGVGRLGVKVARNDRNTINLYLLHKAIGLENIKIGSYNEAWKALLSSAFGLPRDPIVSYSLGLIYEHQDRLARAQSRYKRAVELWKENGHQDPAVFSDLEKSLARVERAILARGIAVNE